MPAYEGFVLLSEKHAVVLDIGSAYTKLGYAGEYQPRKIIPSPKTLFQGNKISEDELYDEFVSFIHSLYFEHLLINPKDRRVVLVESVIGVACWRDVLAKVLFRHFEVLSVLFAPSHLMPLFLLGVKSGLVLDVGYSEAQLIPVYEGVPVLKAWQALPLASEAVQKSLRSALDNNNLSESVIEDIAVRFCYVAPYERGLKIQDNRQNGEKGPLENSKTPDISYPIKGSRTINVKGSVRESVCEVLFEQDIDRLSIPTMILDAISSCSIDTRKELAGNIIFMGGCTLLPGFKLRVITEIKDLCETHNKYSELKVKDHFRVHTPPGGANCTAWLGASIFGATDEVASRSLPREAYLKDAAIPDWANLKFNVLDLGK
eukprot:TRINITY_DN7099_c0_g1_i1.p1 TRINITY_DN7099_c0_g1~~TRINITY_DN7099_c0_g1_i1.p1  ORF type:complete len:374 (-),score=113.44 TRINITY_DN7099_c0_g1_i1:40-1161(-)